MMALSFRNCHTKIRHVDAHATLNEGVVVQVMGELSNNMQPMRKFMQTFVLAPEVGPPRSFPFPLPLPFPMLTGASDRKLNPLVGLVCREPSPTSSMCTTTCSATRTRCSRTRTRSPPRVSGRVHAYTTSRWHFFFPL